MIGLALGGGGVKGSYEIGAYYAFKKCGIKFDGITGTSIGSFNGAVLAAGMDKKLLKFWKTADVGKILGIDQRLVKKINLKQKDFEILKIQVKEFVKLLKQKGVSTSGLEKVLKEFDIEPKLRKSKIDFGLSTLKINNFEHVDLFIDEMKKGSLNNYILASCFFPVFTPKKLEDNSFYFDGGIYNNCPVNMLLEKGYKKVYAIDLKAIGLKEKIIDPSKVINIKPSKRLSGIFSLSKKEILENIDMGYYDTLKVLKNLDGYKYVFNKEKDEYFDNLVKNVPKNLKDKTKKMYRCKTNKEMVIKALESIMLKNEETYYNVYSIRKQIRKYYKDQSKSTSSKFISSLNMNKS